MEFSSKSKSHYVRLKLAGSTDPPAASPAAGTSVLLHLCASPGSGSRAGAKGLEIHMNKF